MKSQREELEKAKKDAIDQLKAEYQKLKETQANLVKQCREIDSELDKKQNGLDNRNNENIELINNKLSFLRDREDRIKQKNGLSIAK